MRRWKYYDQDDCLIHVDDDGYRCSTYSIDRVCEVRKARQESGVYKDYVPNETVEHRLTRKQIRRKSDGKIYNVERVTRQWYFGWYYCALLECDGSHFAPMIENINCFIPETIEAIKKFEEEYEEV